MQVVVPHHVIVTGGFLLFSSVVMTLCLQRKTKRVSAWNQRVTFKKISKNSDLGHCFGLDIGGTLAKIVYFENREERKKRPRSSSHEVAAGEMDQFLRDNVAFGETGVQDIRLRVYSKALAGVFHFIQFETQQTADAVNYLASKGIHQSVRALPCTGGGAHKYADTFRDLAAIELEKHDEIECIVDGLSLLLTTLSDEVYTFEDVDIKTMSASHMRVIEYSASEEVFPYLLVSIGSGVSVLYVTGPREYERVSGSSLGGGTYWGLCRLLTSCNSYDEALDLCVQGSHHEVDMLVKDIYGGSYDKFSLPATTVASSFGKMISRDKSEVTDADLARSLLVMVTQNIGQIAFLNACLYNTDRIFFVGNFLRHNRISAKTLSYAIDFWSNGEKKALFCKHEGYLGALGAFLRHAEATNAHGSEFLSATR